MKKAMVIAIAVLITAFCCFAETQTITLVARVEKQYPQFVIRNNETGEIGSSVVYTTGQIAKRDVRASFDVIQSTDSNWFNTITFTVSATELKAAAKHKVYSTDGVSKYASASRETDYRGLPPCYTFVCDGEPFYEETLTFVRKLNEAGVPAAVDVYRGKVHGFDVLFWTKQAKTARQKLCEKYEKLMK